MGNVIAKILALGKRSNFRKGKQYNSIRQTKELDGYLVQGFSQQQTSG